MQVTDMEEPAEIPDERKATMSNEEYVKALNAIVERALTFSEKGRRETLTALEDFLDKDKVKNRDIFDYGMRFVVDGIDNSIIDEILTNIIKQERDEQMLVLKAIQKEAILAIHEGWNTRIIIALMNSHTDIAMNNPAFKRFFYD